MCVCMHALLHTKSSLVPRPTLPAFQCCTQKKRATLKSWESGPGNEVTQNLCYCMCKTLSMHVVVHELYSPFSVVSVATIVTMIMLFSYNNIIIMLHGLNNTHEVANASLALFIFPCSHKILIIIIFMSFLGQEWCSFP